MTNITTPTISFLLHSSMALILTTLTAAFLTTSSRHRSGNEETFPTVLLRLPTMKFLTPTSRQAVNTITTRDPSLLIITETVQQLRSTLLRVSATRGQTGFLRSTWSIKNKMASCSSGRESPSWRLLEKLEWRCWKEPATLEL